MRVVLIAMMLALMALVATPVLAQEQPVYLPLVGDNAIPNMPPADEFGVHAADINFHIYGFHAVYLMVFPPVPSEPHWVVCWFGDYSTGWSEGGRCDLYKDK